MAMASTAGAAGAGKGVTSHMSEVPDTGPEAPDVHDRVPPETAAAWKQGEERLYLAALTDVGLYQRVLALVGTTVDHLRTRGSGIPGLLAAAAQGAGLVAEAARGKAVATSGLDHLVADAALALRHRELVAEQVGRRRLAALDDARRRGETRAVLEESGESGAVRELDDGSVAPTVSADERARERAAARAWEALTGLAHLPDVHHSE